MVIGSKVKIGNNVVIKSFSHLESCKIENKVEIGPYARIRPGTILKEGSKIGNFVEIKKSLLSGTILDKFSQPFSGFCAIKLIFFRNYKHVKCTVKFNTSHQYSHMCH